MILLDTHVLIWLINAPDRISQSAANALARTSRPALSAASIYEFFYLKGVGRLRTNLSDEAVQARLRKSFEILPITESIAVCAAQFADGFHGDPMDRLIVATALDRGLTLVTRDDRIRESSLCRTLW